MSSFIMMRNKIVQFSQADVNWKENYLNKKKSLFSELKQY